MLLQNKDVNPETGRCRIEEMRWPNQEDTEALGYKQTVHVTGLQSFSDIGVKVKRKQTH